MPTMRLMIDLLLLLLFLYVLQNHGLVPGESMLAALLPMNHTFQIPPLAGKQISPHKHWPCSEGSSLAGPSSLFLLQSPSQAHGAMDQGPFVKEGDGGKERRPLPESLASRNVADQLSPSRSRSTSFVTALLLLLLNLLLLWFCSFLKVAHEFFDFVSCSKLTHGN